MADASFAEFITSRRRELELTLGDVATGLGVSPVTVSGWSSGEATPDPEQLGALADLLQVPADDLASMAGVTLKASERAVNLMPKATAPPEDGPEATTEESTGPIAMLRAASDEPPAPSAAVEPEIEIPLEEEPAAVAPSDADVPPPAPGAIEPERAGEETGSDEMEGVLAELIEGAAADEKSQPEPPVVTHLPGPEEREPPRRRPALRRHRPAAQQPITTLPLTYIEDPKQLTRYRIRWALTVVILVVMFFILLWASRELLSALSEVKQAVTPGGIGG